MLKFRQTILLVCATLVISVATAATTPTASNTGVSSAKAATGVSTTQQALSPAQAQAITNYKQLAMPPDPTQPKENWLVYFGPTAEQAASNKAAAAKRKYVQKASPLQAIPTKRVERNPTWKTLTAKQYVQGRSRGSKGNAQPKSGYGY